jgi:hypothetical protein
MLNGFQTTEDFIHKRRASTSKEISIKKRWLKDFKRKKKCSKQDLAIENLYD